MVPSLETTSTKRANERSTLLQNDDDDLSGANALDYNHTGRNNDPREPGRYPIECLDFDRIINSYSIAATKARHRQQRPTFDLLHEYNSSILSASLESSRHHHKEKKQVISTSGRTIARWVMTCMVAICTGITAVVIIFLVECLVEFRVNRLNRHLQWAYGHATEEEIIRWYHNVRFFDMAAREVGVVGVYLGYTLYNLLLVLISATLVLLLAPQAVGSGIPEVKAYLNGIRVATFADARLFFIKALGTVFAVSSGLVVGPEGPVVHLGAIIGASMTKTGDIEGRLRLFRKSHPKTSKFLGCADHERLDAMNESLSDKSGSTTSRSKKSACWWSDNNIISSMVFYLSHFRNDLERRNLISIGAACGFASAFGAPVGGLLYSMEEASSFFSHDMLWKTLTATALATTCIAIYHGDFTRYSMLSLEIGDTTESLLARFSEVPLYFVMGGLGGLLGAAFNKAFAYTNKSRKHFYDGISHRQGLFLFFKLLECASISILTSVLMLTLPLQASWACQDIDTTISNEGDNVDFLHRYNCKPGQINEVGSLLFGSREESIKDILTNPEDFEPETLLSVGLLFLGLMVVTFGTSIPAGMFMPTVLSGASLGGYAGLVFQRNFISSVHPSDFALIGAAAFLAGMQRNTVSLCVILMEGTGQTKALIPVIITVICARTVGDLFSEGVYEIGMELKHYPYLEHHAKYKYDMYTAATIMTSPVETISIVETAAKIETLLLTSTHNAFPVVDETNRYKGMVRRDQLIAAIECRIFKTRDDSAMPLEEADDHRVSFSLQDQQSAFESPSSSALPHRGLKVYDNGFIYRSVREGHDKKWSMPDKTESVSPWLRDNVLVSPDGANIMFGMDETLPNGMIRNDSLQTVVKVVDDKLVVLVAPNDKERHVDVGSIMNRAAFSVPEDCPLSRAYDLFASMGLRHLPVLNDNNYVIGIISRYNLSEKFVEKKTY